MKEPAHITMKDIARVFGTSVATVSRALSGSPRISKDVREAIQAYAREHNFFPNVVAQSLSKSNARPMRIIGVIVPEIRHFYFSSVLSGIADEAWADGYQIMVARSAEDYEREVRICESFHHMRVCGIIVSQTKQTVRYEHFQRLADNGVPLVFYDRICRGLNASRVVVDDYAGAYHAVSYMIETGCRRIAFYNSPMTIEISTNRYNGYRDAVLRHGLQVDERLIRACDSRAEAESVTAEMLAMDAEERPDAFFAVNDDTAIGALYAAKRAGFRVPDDVSVCGFTNNNASKSCDPMLTTVEQRGIEVGREAARIIIGYAEGTIPKDKIVRKVVRTQLLVRGTTRPLAAAEALEPDRFNREGNTLNIGTL